MDEQAEQKARAMELAQMLIQNPRRLADTLYGLYVLVARQKARAEHAEAALRALGKQVEEGKA